MSCDLELQGHAIKNQDLLIASGTIPSKGSEGMSAVDDDMEAAVSRFYCLLVTLRKSRDSFPPPRIACFSLSLVSEPDSCLDRRRHSRSTSTRSRVDRDSKVYLRPGGAFQGLERTRYRPRHVAG